MEEYLYREAIENLGTVFQAGCNLVNFMNGLQLEVPPLPPLFNPTFPLSSNPNRDVKVVGFMSHTSKIYLVGIYFYLCLIAPA
jgi:hypothetical protein